MKRFWLLLLLFVMPLQTSWAAVHFCDDDLAAATVIAEPSGSHDHAAPGKQTNPQGGQALVDACCGAAHGCHGLHNLMAQAPYRVLAAANPGFAVSTDHRLIQRQFADRHERPQWPVA